MLEDVLRKYGASEVSAMEMYGDIFRLGTGFIQRSSEIGSKVHKANPIILGSFDGVIRRRILFDDRYEEILREFQEADWAITNGLTYWGHANRADAQSKMCAMAFDLDGQDDTKLNTFLHGAFGGGGWHQYPLPQYVVLSGSNVHLYYVFEEPLSLYPNTKTQLKRLKYALTDLMWNMYTSNIEKPQHQGINQGFRIVGGKTKSGGRVRAFRVNAHPASAGELNGYVAMQARVEEDSRYRESKYTLEEARSLFPEWYESVIERGEPRCWYANEGLYAWWLRKCREKGTDGGIDGRYYTNVGVTYGHRYFCVMALAIFAVKCGILDRERVKADAMSLMERFNEINPDAPFTEADIDSALECLDLRYVKFPRKDIEKITAVMIPPNKRNGRKQVDHLKLARFARDLNYSDQNGWQNKNGAPTKRDLIRAYAREHPDANHSDIAKALDVSRTTVVKWLKSD